MTRHTVLRGLAALALAATGCQQGGAMGGSSGPVTLTTEDDKTLYALGTVVGKNLGTFQLTPAELEIVKSGLADQVQSKKLQVDLETYGPKIQALAQARQGAQATAEKAKSTAFLDTAAKEPGAVKTDSGMIFKSLTPGKGESPKATDKVKVNYEGKLTDGTVFDSSYKRNQPAEFPLNGVIPCWTEGVQKMKVGEKAQLTCPSSIAYGDRGHPPTIPGGATLQFTVELLSIEAGGATAPAMPGMPAGMMPPGHAGMMPPGHPGMMPPMRPGTMPPGHPVVPPPADKK